MYLRDVMVLPNCPGDFKHNLGLLRQATDHVTDILRHFLPDKYNLHGQRRVVILLGNHIAPPKQYLEVDSVAEYHVPDFDLGKFLGKPSHQQEEEILGIMERVLLDMAHRFGTETDPVQTTVQCVRETGFRLETELPVSKTHKSRKLRVHVIRRFAPGGVNVRAEIRKISGELLDFRELLSNAWVVTATQRFRGSRWEGDTLKLFDSSGFVAATIPCGDYLETL